jgi:hypothetical protein
MTNDELEDCIKAHLGPDKYLRYLKSKKQAELKRTKRAAFVATLAVAAFTEDDNENVLDFDIKREDELLERWGLRKGPFYR